MINRIFIYAIMLVTLGRGLDFFPALASLQLGKVILALATLHVCVFSFASLRQTLRSNPLMPYVALIVLLAACGISFSVWRGGAFGSFTDYLKTVCVFVVLCALASGGAGGRYAPAMRRAIAATVGMLALLMLAATTTGRLQTSNTYDPNDIALLFVTFLPIVICEALSGNRLLRIPAWGVAGAALVGIALTQSRGGIVALGVVAVHALLLAKKRSWLLLPLLATAAALILTYTDTQLWERFQELRSQEDYNFDARSGRLEIWKEGLRFMVHRPLFGVGIGQFSSALGMIGSGVYHTAHNSFIQIGAELGVAGLGVYCAMLLRIRRLCIDAPASPAQNNANRLRWQALRLSLTGFAVGSFFLSQAYGFVLYALLALAAVMHEEDPREAAAAVAPDEPEPKTAKAERARNNELAGQGMTNRAAAARAARESLLRRGDARHTARGARP